MAGTNTPNSTGRATAASKRAAAAVTNSNGRPRRAAGDASPYASTSTGKATAGSSSSPSKGKGKGKATSTGKAPTTTATVAREEEGGDSAAADVTSGELQTGSKDDAEPEAPPAEQTRIGSERNPSEATTEPVLTSDAKETVPSTTTTTAPTASVEAQTHEPDPRSKATVPAPLSGVAPPAPTDSSASSSSSSAPSLSGSAPPAAATNGEGGRRKSVRSTRSKGLDYANLNQHLPASVDRWTSTIDARTKSGQIVSGFAAAPPSGTGAADGLGRRRFANGYELEKMGDEWIYGSSSSSSASGSGSGSASSRAESGGVGAPESGGGGGEGMMEPFVVESPEGLGMEMPKAGISVRVVADLVGPDTPLEVIDCASQSSLSNWTLGQWADYYDDPQRDKVRNVISLEVSESKLGKMITAPTLVRKLDWVDTIWPEDMKVPGEYPRVQKYCLMSVERCWTDWHVDFAGSSVFYHVLRGGKTFFFIRPTPANLKAYEEWSGSSERQESTWLGDSCDRVYRMDLREGNTAFIPTGWIHAVYTPADSLVIGGNFLHSLNIPTQLRVYEIELATKVPRKFRYPHFVKLLWLVARHYHTLLASPTLLDTPREARPAELRSPRVLQGLKQLSSFLIQQTTRFARGAQVSAERKRIARENVPWSKVPDPVSLSREFRKVVLRALGEDLDPECFLPHVAAIPADEDDKSAPPHANGVKRKASEALDGHADAQAALSAKVKRTASSASTQPIAFVPYQVGMNGDGEIIGRHTVPVVSVTRMEERLDPGSLAAPSPRNGPAVLAEVKESRSTQSVVRRWVSDPTDPTGRGGPVVETRTVVTIVERVKFPHPQSVHRVQQQPYAQYDTTAGTAYEQASGIGPPAPPSVTAVPGSLASSVSRPHRSQNAEPYQPYGWPYQYDLSAPPSSSQPSNGTTPQQQQQAHVPQYPPPPLQHFAPQQQQQTAPAYPPAPAAKPDPQPGTNQNMLSLPPLPSAKPSSFAPHLPHRVSAAAGFAPSMPRPPAEPKRSSFGPPLADLIAASRKEASMPPLPAEPKRFPFGPSLAELLAADHNRTSMPPPPAEPKRFPFGPSLAELLAADHNRTSMPPPPVPRRSSSSSHDMPPQAASYQQQQEPPAAPAAYDARTAEHFGYTVSPTTGAGQYLPPLPQPPQHVQNGFGGGGGGTRM